MTVVEPGGRAEKLGVKLTKLSAEQADYIGVAQDGPFKAESDLTDMKALVDDLMPGGVELHHYMRSAHIAPAGRPD